MPQLRRLLEGLPSGSRRADWEASRLSAPHPMFGGMEEAPRKSTSRE